MSQVLRSYFYKEIKTSMMATGIRIPEIAVSYTADLLSTEPMVLPDAIFDVLEASINEGSRHKRLSLYKQVGDSGLLLSGAFRPYIERKGISLNYYRDLSVFAYRSAGGLVLDDTIYRDMEANFTKVSDILDYFFWGSMALTQRSSSSSDHSIK